ncbi:TPA: hypothetical protein NKO30_006903 [Pseudomonas aeruginosa]|nr:hypothetical protein [Pseudomonas aeruginosa]
MNASLRISATKAPPGRKLCFWEKTVALLGAAGLCVSVHAQTVEYIHTDALGSPVAITNANGNVIERTEYAPYGDVLNRPDTDGPGYSAHVLDAATGLNYMQQRYYDPVIGRFLSVDPIAAYSNRGISFNRYWYANDNPYRFTDPDGRWVCSDGGRGSCSKFETALNRVADAAKSGRLSQSEQGRLQRIVSFYGVKGDDKVSVSFANLGGPGGNASMRADGGEHVTLDMGAATRKSEDRTLNVLARVVTHEGEHGANDQQRGRPVSSLAERKTEEVEGYRSQATYQKAANFAESSADGWTPGGGYNEEQIERQGQGSVDASCNGNTNGSCR